MNSQKLMGIFNKRGPLPAEKYTATVPLEEAMGRIKALMAAKKKHIRDTPDVHASAGKVPVITPDTFGKLDAEIYHNNLNWNILMPCYGNPTTAPGKMLLLARKAKNLEKSILSLIDQQRSFNSSVAQSINTLRDLAYYQDREIRRLKAEMAEAISELEAVRDGRALKAIGPPAAYGGGREELEEKRKSYVKFFTGGGTVLDAWCGRGDFLKLLLENHVSAIGVDSDGEMVGYCLERGLPAVRSDIQGYLASVGDDSLAGIYSAAAIGSLPSSGIVDFIRLAFTKLKPSGVLIVEAVAPECPEAATGMPPEGQVHPSTMRFIFESLGFKATISRGGPFRPRDYAAIGIK